MVDSASDLSPKERGVVSLSTMVTSTQPQVFLQKLGEGMNGLVVL